MSGSRSFTTGVALFLAFVAGTTVGRLSALPRTAQAKPADPPPRYAHLRNPYDVSDRAVLAEGERIYNRYCWGCHGAMGDGMGPGSPDIVPRPADFTNRARVARLSDGYWFWRVKEGYPDDPKRLMPAWGKVLTDDEIWKVITYEKTFALKKKG